MDNNIQNYRQPMVTATGVILGFVLGFTGTWAKEPVEKTTLSDYFISFGLLSSIILLIITLYRMLNNNYPEEKISKYYRKTLKTFIFGVSLAFLGILMSIFQTMFGN